jgi:nucleotide-binding universal stress UspA family protein
MIPPKQLLVATDFSAGADCAADVAIGLAARWDAAIDWAHVTSEPSHSLTPSSNALVTEYVEHEHRVARDGLAELRERAAARGVASDVHVIEGRADVALVSCAEAQGSDWLVGGAQGRSGIHSLLIGSVVEKIARSSPLPTLVIRPGPALAEGGTLVFGEDLHSSETRRSAVAVADALKMQLFAVHAIEIASMADTAFSASPELLEASEREAHERLASLSRELGDGARSMVCLGGASGALCDAARRQHAGLIVTGQTSRKGLERWMLGSVAEKTLRHAPCSVLILK